MSKLFKAGAIDQSMLLSPSVQELVPEGHLAHFVRDTVRDSLDLSAIVATYTEDRGFPPYDPTMMTALLLYAYCQGLYASRRIAKACEERVDFMAVTARPRPDFRTAATFGSGLCRRSVGCARRCSGCVRLRGWGSWGMGRSTAPRLRRTPQSTRR